MSYLCYATGMDNAAFKTLSIVGEMSVFYLYLINVFDYTFSEYGYLNTYRFLVNLVGKFIVNDNDLDGRTFFGYT